MRASSFDHVCTDAGLAPWPADVRAFLFARLRNVIGTTSRRRLSGRSAVTIGLLVLATVTNGPLAAGVARADVARGSLNDWVDAVCSYDPGRLTADPVPQWICPGIRQGANDVSFDTLWFIFQFTSQSQMESNRQLLRRGFGYATCTASDGSVTAFVSDVSGIGSQGNAIQITNRALQPLKNFGCTVTDNVPRQSSTATGIPPASAGQTQPAPNVSRSIYQTFYDDMRAVGAVPADNEDLNFVSAGVLLCHLIWKGDPLPGMMDHLNRIISYRDLNQMKAVAKQDFCPTAPNS